MALNVAPEEETTTLSTPHELKDNETPHTVYIMIDDPGGYVISMEMKLMQSQISSLDFRRSILLNQPQVSSARRLQNVSLRTGLEATS